MNVVISQSMYFPWVGMLEQIRLADVFVFYDDVQFSKGSFTNRVQVKLPSGVRTWMTVPLLNHQLGQRIDEVRIKDSGIWAAKHLSVLEQSFRGAPFAQEALDLAAKTLSNPGGTIAELSRASMLALAEYYGLDQDTEFVNSTDLNVAGKGSQRVLDIVQAIGGNTYVTGHGAWQYLDHDLFEKAGLEVAYMDYQCRAYPQSHGDFTPYVSALDLIANMGPRGIELISSSAVYWKDIGNES